jgi:hypothetical protein
MAITLSESRVLKLLAGKNKILKGPDGHWLPQLGNPEQSSVTEPLLALVNRGSVVIVGAGEARIAPRGVWELLEYQAEQDRVKGQLKPAS